MCNIKQLDHEYLAQTYRRFEIVLNYGKGCEVWDTDGKRYIDFTSGIGVNSLGWADEKWLQAVVQQASMLQHTSNLFYTQPATQLAEKLVKTSGLKRVFFCNSGAEANEGAIKAARKYSADHYGANRSTILSLVNSFHGRTISTLAATGQESFHRHFFPFTSGFEHLPANYLEPLKQRLRQHDVCAVMLEVVQGEGGLHSLESEYLQGVQALCREHDILLLIDEVQTGIGRSGKMFAYQHFGLTPDIVTLAKGLGGGLPIGAVLFGEKCEQTFSTGDHGSTFGANPVSCAAANVVMDRLNEPFLEEVARKGEYLRSALMQLPKVKSVSGLGLMLGVEFEEGINASDVVSKAMAQGILFLTAKHKLRLLPPLIISETQIAEGIGVLQQILEEYKV